MTTNNNNNIKQWSNRSPEEREQIRVNQERASYASPFRGKNRAQRYRLHNGFNAMASVLTKRGMN